MDILIKNGTVFDGTGAPPKKADIAVSRGKIEGIGTYADIQAGTVIDAEGKYITPGFVDILNHSDSYLTILKTPQSESLLRQGITTALIGNCGSSLAPLIHGNLITSMQKWGDIRGLNINWERFGEFLAALSVMKLGVNVASLVGHATLRRGFLDHSMEEANDEQIKKMNRLLSDAFAEGAFGLSFAPAYLHGRPAGSRELTPLVKLVAEHNGLFSAHLRNEGEKVLDSINEIIGLVKETGVRAEIAHFKISGPASWNLNTQALALIDAAIKDGLLIHFDVYPYLRSLVVLYLLFPHWAQVGGRRAMLDRLKNPEEHQKIAKEIESGQYRDVLGNITVGIAHRDKTFLGKRINDIAANQGVSNAEAICNLMTANEGRVSVFIPDISKANLQFAFMHDASFIATSGGGYDESWKNGVELPHPRSFGAFPRALAVGTRKWNMSWEKLINKMTWGPAQHIGLLDRGRIDTGMPADIVVFDPQKVAGRALFKNPFRFATGIEYVVVNGKVAVTPKGTQPIYAGQVLRRKH